MHHSINALLDYHVVADDTAGRVEDFLFDETRLTLSAIAVDLGNWLVPRSAVLSIDRLGTLDAEKRELPLSITAEEAEDAPAVDDWHGDWFDAPGYTAWPPIIIGPAGGTISPLLLRAQAQHLTRKAGLRTGQDLSSEVPGDSRRLRSAAATLSASVFCPDGECGRIADLLLAPDCRQIRFLIVDAGGFLSHERFVVPVAGLSHFAAGDDYAVLHVNADALASGRIDGGVPDDAWLAGLEEHYRRHVVAA